MGIFEGFRRIARRGGGAACLRNVVFVVKWEHFGLLFNIWWSVFCLCQYSCVVVVVVVLRKCCVCEDILTEEIEDNNAPISKRLGRSAPRIWALWKQKKDNNTPISERLSWTAPRIWALWRSVKSSKWGYSRRSYEELDTKGVCVAEMSSLWSNDNNNKVIFD